MTAANLPALKNYTAEEKTQLLANLDLEVAHRTRQFEAWLTDALENFRIHQEGLISRVPRLVRDITMRDFAKYNGDVQECLKGIQRERLGGDAGTIDKTTRKRKWVESQETVNGGDHLEAESSKAPKNARTMMATPKKKNMPLVAPGTAGRSRLPVTRTPGTVRMATRAPSPSPHKPTNKAVLFPKLGPGIRPGSPSKSQVPSRVPSTTSFNPVIPSASHPRWPRRDESMLSVNGSPLANPYQLGMGFPSWLSAVPEDGGSMSGGDNKNPQRTHKRTNSIIVRTASGSGSNTRPNSQAGSVAPSQPSHSRTNSTATGSAPARNKSPMEGSQDDPKTPVSSTMQLSRPAAMVAVPTKDGHILEFDPLHTTPAEIDALEGITDSAKKQARADIARLVMQAVELWKIA